jgi:hypothetical protein
MLKFALEIACRGAENHVEKFGKSPRKVQKITWKSRGNHVEKQRKSPREVQEIAWKSVNTFRKNCAATRQRGSAAFAKLIPRQRIFMV